MSKPNDVAQPDDEIPLDELLPLIEFGCWTAIVLFPFLYYVNGPAVSTDQLVVRTILIIVAVVGAVLLRFVNWRRRKRQATAESTSATQTAPDVVQQQCSHPDS